MTHTVPEPAVPESVLLRRGSIPPQRTDFELDEFEAVGKPLGRGAFGYVSKVKQRDTGKFFAMKVMSKTKIEELNLEENIEREISTQQRLVHPHILRLYKYFEDEEDIHLLLEYAPNGSLFDLLRDLRKAAAVSNQVQQGLPEARAAGMFGDVAGALHFLHCNGVVHRDLKPENILICEDDVVKLADFGWCNQLAKESAGRNTFCGTWEYLSPEMINNEPHDCSVDAWAAGVLLFEMLVGRSPFAASSYVQALGKISKVAYEFPDHVSASARDLVGRLLVREPGQRLGLGKAADHAWVRDTPAGDGGVQRSAQTCGGELAGPCRGACDGPLEAEEAHAVEAHAAEARGGSSPEGPPQEGRSWKTVRRRFLEEPTSSSRGAPGGRPAEARDAPPEGAPPEGPAAGAGSPEGPATQGRHEPEEEPTHGRHEPVEGQQRSEARRRLMSATQRRSLKDLHLALAEADRLEFPRDCALMEHARAVLAALACAEEGGSDSEGSTPRRALEATASVPLIRVVSSGDEDRVECSGIRSEPAAGSGSGARLAIPVRSKALPGATAHFLESLQPRKGSPRKATQLLSPRKARASEDPPPPSPRKPSHALAQLLSPRKSSQLLSPRRLRPVAGCRRAPEADGEPPGAATAPVRSLLGPAPDGQEAASASGSGARRRSESDLGFGCDAAGFVEPAPCAGLLDDSAPAPSAGSRSGPAAVPAAARRRSAPDVGCGSAPARAFDFAPSARAAGDPAALFDRGLSPRSEGNWSEGSGGGRTPRSGPAASASFASGGLTPRPTASTGVGLREHLALRRRQLRVQGGADDLDSSVSSVCAGDLLRKDSTASTATCPARLSQPLPPELRGRDCGAPFSPHGLGAAPLSGGTGPPGACSLAEEEDLEGALDCVVSQPSLEGVLDCSAPSPAAEG